MAVALLTDSDRFPFDDDDRATLALAGVELRELPGHEPGRLVEAGRDADVIFIYYGKFTRDVIEQLDGCRVLARCGTGYDNIDVAAARARGIEVVYVPDYGIDDVSDHALALLLACARKIALADRAVRRGEWPHYARLAPLRRLQGQTLGFLGYGRIARALARKARPLGLRLIAHDPYVGEADVELVARDELFARADIVSIHVPLSDETRGTVGKREFRLMKPNSVVINTSRGAVVEEQALAKALSDGVLAAAGIDVFETQPLPSDHPLRGCETAVFTPHSAAHTEESLAEVRKRPLADALRVLRGEAPLHPVP
ncbi:MAG: C-terminal binding protein [Actinomycetota bacterium]|nr:C-terminal binding protein [Actinomycetota bacterium]